MKVISMFFQYINIHNSQLGFLEIGNTPSKLGCLSSLETREQVINFRLIIFENLSFIVFMQNYILLSTASVLFCWYWDQ